MAAAADPSRPMSPARRARLVESLTYVVRALEVVSCVTDAPVEPAAEDSWLLGTPVDDGRLEAFGERWGCARQVARLADLLRAAPAA